MTQSNYVTMVNSWLEQRDWAINYAVEALRDMPLHAEITNRLEQLRVPEGKPDLTGYVQVTDFSTIFKVAEAVEIGFSSDSGAINHLTFNGKQIASSDNLLASLIYQTFTAHDFEVRLRN